MSHVRCKWIPGTFTGVKVMTPNRTFHVDVQNVQRVLGDDAVWNLYLKGHFQHDVPDATVERLMGGTCSNPAMLRSDALRDRPATSAEAFAN